MDKERSQNDKYEATQQYKERFIRWQQLTLTQLSNTNNLILTLTLGMLAFTVTKIGLKIPENGFLLFLYILSYFVLLVSLLSGVLLTVNRLYDFRKTKEIVKFKRQKSEVKYDNEKTDNLKMKIAILQHETDKHGKRTWCLFHIQLWLFFAGSVISIITIIIIQSNN